MGTRFPGEVRKDLIKAEPARSVFTEFPAILGNMPQAAHDSGLALLHGSWSDAAWGGDCPCDLPVLDLTSTGPLPLDLSEMGRDPTAPVLSAPIPVPAPAIAGASGEEDVFQSADGSLSLRGDVLLCACPDCSAPLSIRLWLMLADCWRCATTIELSEEQEREVERLLKRRDEVRQEAARRQAASVPAEKVPAPRPRPAEAKPTPPPEQTPPPPPPLPPPETKTPPPSPRPVSQPEEQPPPPRRVAASKKPIGVRAKYRKLAVLGGARLLVREFFRNMPAWVISLLLHLILITILGLIYFGEETEEPYILLSQDIQVPRVEGGDPAQIVENDPQFDLPVSEKPKTPEQMRALIAADQEARELRLDPDAPLLDLPELSQIKEVIGASDAPQRMLAARDPRLRIDMVKLEGGTTMTEAAVARGLQWISRQQNEDGGWGLQGGASDAAGSSLALLPFLGAGQTHQTGIYREEVSQGLRWLIEHQRPDGDLRYGTSGNHGMYAHGQAAIVLCEAYAMTGDEQLRIPAQTAIDFIVQAQHPAGGWRYSPRQEGDTSVFGWQLMALQSAQAAKLTVPDSTLELASHYLDAAGHEDGTKYSYQPGQPLGSPSRESAYTMTAEGLLCRVYLGWNRHDNPPLSDGVNWLVDNYLPDERQSNMYYWYYATQLMHHYGGPQWERWNMKIRNALTETQVSSGADAGSWNPAGQHGSAGGRIYMTSLATCTLEVYYRHAPIFRQIKLD